MAPAPALQSGSSTRALILGVLALAAGCAGVTPGATTGKGGSATAGTSGGGTTGTGGAGGSAVDAGGDRPMIVLDAGPEGGGCTPTVTCTPPNGRYCGVIGNGCFATIDCGACPTGQMCESGICVGDELHAARLPADDGQVLRQRRGRLRPGDGLRRLRGQARPAAPRACAWRRTACR